MNRPMCEQEFFHAMPCPCTCLHTVHPVRNHAEGCPEYITNNALNPSEIADLIGRFRAEGKALQGDGFGYIGNVKGQIKRVCVQLEELHRLLTTEIAPVEPKVVSNNPDCFGEYGENVLDCNCRIVFSNIHK